MPSLEEIVELKVPERVVAAEGLRYKLKVTVREEEDWSCRSSAVTSRAREPYRVDPELLTTLDT